MIYLDREVQHDVIELFDYSLRPDGVLLVGTGDDRQLGAFLRGRQEGQDPVEVHSRMGAHIEQLKSLVDDLLDSRITQAKITLKPTRGNFTETRRASVGYARVMVVAPSLSPFYASPPTASATTSMF